MTMIVNSITRVSTSSTGVQANGGSTFPVISADGTKVLFTSDASNLVAGDTNGTNDLFIKDLVTGTITLVSTSAAGVQANNQSDEAFFTPDGSKIIFASYASNLVAGDTNNDMDIFMKDLATGTVTLLSSRSNGVIGNGFSISPTVSPDGMKVAFTSYATNLVSGDNNNRSDIFVKDLATNQTIRVSTSATGVQGNDYSMDPVFSADGKKIAFTSYASNLVAGDTNGTADVFVKDLVTGSVTLLSSSSANVQGNFNSSQPVFSADGTKVMFLSEANNLVAGDTNGAQDIFVKDLVTGITTIVSTSIGGVVGNGASGRPVFSTDGTQVAFFTSATNLFAHDVNHAQDIVIKDLITGAVSQVSINLAGIGADNFSDFPSFTFDGHQLVFVSGAGNLVAGDTNNAADIFVVSITESGVIDGTNGNDTIYGRETDETISGIHGNDTIYGNGGNDNINGGHGDDTLYGGIGNDNISGAAGDDRIYGDDGNDTLSGNAGNDLLRGGAGDDKLSGSDGNDTLYGDGGQDTLRGGNDDDTLYGGGASDKLYGDAGNDLLYGGTGTNTLTGGAGADGFVLNADAFDGTTDKIADFNPIDGDYLLLDHILTGFDPLTSAISDYVTATTAGSNTLIAIDRDGSGTAYTAQTVASLLGVTGVDVQDLYDANAIKVV